MTEHRLDPLLKPGSIALLGASDRDESPGQILARMVIQSDYPGAIYPVNPGYQSILGLSCYANLEALPETVDHVVIAVGNAHLETALQATIAHGARAATIYSSAVPESDSEPTLKKRLSSMAAAANLQVCGINGMGFYNLLQPLYAGIFERPGQINAGTISLIAQSGSAFTALSHNGLRLGFNLCVSAGDEMATTVADYMDWSLNQPETGVIALFLETVRDPTGFVEALQKAQAQDVPVVVLKIGKSAMAASMAVTHTGAIAGNHAAFQALCQRHGVIEVDDLDEMAATLMLLQNGRRSANGEFAAMFESGGFREMVTDAASELGIGFARLEDATVAAIEKQLDPGLKAENPLDAWGTHDNFEARFEACLLALMQDAGVSAGAFFSNFRDDYFLSEAIFRVVEAVSRQTDKPIALANCYSDLSNTAMCQRGFDAGIPIVDGMREMLLACKHLATYRDFRQQPSADFNRENLDSALLATCRQRIENHSAATIGEHDALALLADLSFPVVRNERVDNRDDLIAVAASIGYPLVLKTAQANLDHKSDCHGVFVNMAGEAELLVRYDDLNSRLGPAALLSPMVAEGIEVALGTVNDPQFGPIIMVAAGGILVELMDDRKVALCPVNQSQAEAMIASLKISQLLDGVRGKPAANRQALADAVVSLSQIAFQLRDCIAEIDVNPIIVNSAEALAVDALILPQKPAPKC